MVHLFGKKLKRKDALKVSCQKSKKCSTSKCFFWQVFEVWMAFLESSAPLHRTGTVGTVYFLQTLSSQHSSKGWFVSVEINLTISTINCHYFLPPHNTCKLLWDAQSLVLVAASILLQPPYLKSPTAFQLYTKGTCHQ